MTELNLPKYNMRISRDRNNNIKIFDSIRKKFVSLTPEEYVRQHFTNWLINYLHYPMGLVANEVKISLNSTIKRCDTVVYSNTGDPMMIIEYKAPHISINQNVFDQIVRYNMVLKTKYLVVSNGMQHYCCIIDYENNSYQFIPHIPTYEELIIGTTQN